MSPDHVTTPQKEATWVTHHSLSVAFVCVALCVAGVYSAYRLPSSVFPQTDFPRVVILVDNDQNPIEPAASIEQAKEFTEFWEWLNANYREGVVIEDFHFYRQK